MRGSVNRNYLTEKAKLSFFLQLEIMRNQKQSVVNSSFGKVILTIASDGVVLQQEGKTGAIALEPEGMEKLAKALLAVKKNRYSSLSSTQRNKSSPLMAVPVPPVPSLTAAPTSYMEQQKTLHSKAYAAWTTEEEDRLKVLHARGKTVNEMANELGRNTGAIRNRLKRLGLS